MADSVRVDKFGQVLTQTTNDKGSRGPLKSLGTQMLTQNQYGIEGTLYLLEYFDGTSHKIIVQKRHLESWGYTPHGFTQVIWEGTKRGLLPGEILERMQDGVQTAFDKLRAEVEDELDGNQ